MRRRSSKFIRIERSPRESGEKVSASSRAASRITTIAAVAVASKTPLGAAAIEPRPEVAGEKATTILN